MIDKEFLIKEQLEILENEYLKLFFAFSITRTDNRIDAEDLSAEICYQCVTAINKGKINENFNAYLWSIAHNTYKRFIKNKNKVVLLDNNYMMNIVDASYEEDDTIKVQSTEIRKQLRLLSKLYRESLISFYYDEMPISKISDNLNISKEMVKFYLMKGREKLKENFNMVKEFGEKSFRPSDFSVYYSGIDFAHVNVWQLFRRKLPCQIALICFDRPKSVEEISVELGTPSVFIEDELQILLNSGLIIESGKNKYHTNFFILKKEVLVDFKEIFVSMYRKYVPHVINIFNEYLPELKKCKIFKFNTSDNRYKWFFSQFITDFDYSNFFLSEVDYPNILSCGARAFVFGDEGKGSKWSFGATPTDIGKAKIWAVDSGVLGKFRYQKELRNVKKAKCLYDIYCENINDQDKEIYAQLIKEGYVVKVNGEIISNVACFTHNASSLIEKINIQLKELLKKESTEIYKKIEKIVYKTIPKQLKENYKGFVNTLIKFYAGTFFREILFESGFMSIEENIDEPILCYIQPK